MFQTTNTNAAGSHLKGILLHFENVLLSGTCLVVIQLVAPGSVTRSVGRFRFRLDIILPLITTTGT